MRKEAIAVRDRRKIKYLRVSMEDAAVAAGEELESLSIGGQRLCMREYVASHPDLGNIDEFEELVDDGHSGTNFDRPGVTRLLELVEAGQVETIIVRDMSRFGRNYLEVGHFLEFVFPAFDVRFISINDHFDSADLNGSTAGFHMAIRNLINQMYSRDISRKIKSAVDLKKLNGEFVYGTAPYGYQKGAEKNTIVIDPEAAQTVRQIFQWAAGGVTVSDIAKRLNVAGVVSPSEYLKALRGKYKTSRYWSYESVRNILLNRIYTGDTVPFKSHVVTVGSKRTKAIPEEEQLILPDTHEAIVSRELYYQARCVVKSNVKSPSCGSSLLSTYLVCGCCGNKLQKGRRTNRTFRCATSRYAPDAPCKDVHIEEKYLADILLRAVQSQCALADAKVRLAKAVQKDTHAQQESLQRDIRDQKRLIDRSQTAVMQAYEDYVAGKLGKEEFVSEKQRRRETEEAAKLQLALLEKELAALNAENQVQEAVIQEAGPLRRFDGVTELTPALIRELVQRVIIYPSGAIHIDWNFKDSIKAEAG